MNMTDLAIEQQRAALCESVTLTGDEWRLLLANYETLLEVAIWYSVIGQIKSPDGLVTINDGAVKARQALETIGASHDH